MRLTLSVFAIFLAGATPAAAHHEQGAPPHELRVIRSYAPDLMHRELRRVPVSWSHLRRMVASRWRATHPAAEWHRRLSDLIYEPTPEGNREIARHFFGDSYSCAATIIQGESGWLHDVAYGGARGARLIYSGLAYGLGQARPGTKMLAYGRDAATNPKTQLIWFRAYAEARYGGICQAAAHWSQGRSW